MKKLLLTVCMFLIVSPIWAGWTKTNNKEVSTTSNPAALTAFTNALTPGSIIIVGVRKLSAVAIPTPTDDAGNTYADCGAGQVPYSTSTRLIALFYTINSHNTAANVIYFANTLGTNHSISAVEWTGGAASSIVDGTPASNPNANTGTGGGQNVISTATTPTFNGDLIIGYGKGATNWGYGTGFTIIGASQIGLEYKIQTTAAAIQATWTDATNNETYAALVVAFKLLGAGTKIMRSKSQGWH